MRLVTSNQLSDLAEIYSDDVELVSIARPNFERIESLSQRLILSGQAHQVQWVQATDGPNVAEEQLPEPIEASVRSMLANQITEGCDVLGALLGCAKVGVRRDSQRCARPCVRAFTSTGYPVVCSSPSAVAALSGSLTAMSTGLF